MIRERSLIYNRHFQLYTIICDYNFIYQVHILVLQIAQEYKLNVFIFMVSFLKYIVSSSAYSEYTKYNLTFPSDLELK